MHEVCLTRGSGNGRVTHVIRPDRTGGKKKIAVAEPRGWLNDGDREQVSADQSEGIQSFEDVDPTARHSPFRRAQYSARCVINVVEAMRMVSEANLPVEQFGLICCYLVPCPPRDLSLLDFKGIGINMTPKRAFTPDCAVDVLRSTEQRNASRHLRGVCRIIEDQSRLIR